jgi:hypothetical protein
MVSFFAQQSMGVLIVGIDASFIVEMFNAKISGGKRSQQRSKPHIPPSKSGCWASQVLYFGHN